MSGVIRDVLAIFAILCIIKMAIDCAKESVRVFLRSYQFNTKPIAACHCRDRRKRDPETQECYDSWSLRHMRFADPISTEKKKENEWKMIKLKVEEYCQNCPEFKPEVTTTELQCMGEKRVIPNTAVRCEHAARCNAMVGYLKWAIEGSNDDEDLFDGPEFMDSRCEFN